MGTLTVREVLLLTAIDEVRGLAGTSPALEDLIDTQEFVRTVIEDGRLVLVVRPAAPATSPSSSPTRPPAAPTTPDPSTGIPQPVDEHGTICA